MTRIHVEDHFDELGLEFDGAMRRALVIAGEATKQAAERNAPKGATGRLENSIHLSDVHPITTGARVGYRIEVFAGMFYGRFLEFGTLGSRKKKLKDPGRRRQNAPEGSGIEPRYFMLHAGRETAGVLPEAIDAELRRL